MSKPSRPATRFVPRLEQLENRMLLAAVSVLSHHDGPSGRQDFYHESAPRDHARQAPMPSQHQQSGGRPDRRDARQGDRGDLHHSRRAADEHTVFASPRDSRRHVERLSPPPQRALPAASETPDLGPPRPAQPSIARPTLTTSALPPPPQLIPPSSPQLIPTRIPISNNLAPPITRQTAPPTSNPTTIVAETVAPASTDAPAIAAPEDSVPVRTQTPNEEATSVTATLTPQPASSVAAEVARTEPRSPALPFAWSVTEMPDDEESDEARSEFNRFGGIIELDNQPNLRETLPEPAIDLRLDSSGGLGRSETQEPLSESSDEDIPKTLRDTQPEWSNNDAETADSDDVAIETKEAETTTSRETADPRESHDLAFAEFDDVEAYGGIIEFADDIAVQDDLITDEIDEDLARDRAMQVDTIIGMAPLLELNLREEEVPAEAEPDAVLSPTAKRAAAVALALMPWRIKKDQRIVVNNRVLMVD